jgi:hypothetical protein
MYWYRLLATLRTKITFNRAQPQVEARGPAVGTQPRIGEACEKEHLSPDIAFSQAKRFTIYISICHLIYGLLFDLIAIILLLLARVLIPRAVSTLVTPEYTATRGQEVKSSSLYCPR